MNDHSNRLFLEVRQPILIGLHGSKDLLDRVASQYDEVDQQQWPEDIDFYHLEIGANCAHNEGKRSTLPDLDLAERTSQRFIIRVLQIESYS